MATLNRNPLSILLSFPNIQIIVYATPDSQQSTFCPQKSFERQEHTVLFVSIIHHTRAYTFGKTPQASNPYRNAGVGEDR